MKFAQRSLALILSLFAVSALAKPAPVVKQSKLVVAKKSVARETRPIAVAVRKVQSKDEKKTPAVKPLVAVQNKMVAKLTKARPVSSLFSLSNIKYMIFNYREGKFLEEKDANDVWPIASLTKLMTAHVFINNHPDFSNCKTQITEEDTDWLKNTGTRLKKNSDYDCENLLEVMLTSSDNYAASALARSIPGWTKQNFINKMNEQALSWGLTNTKFVDSSGLSPQNSSSAHDYSKLMLKLFENKPLLKYAALPNITAYTRDNRLSIFNNSNMLIRQYGYDAVISKTGHINESGYNLAFLSATCPIGIVQFGASSSPQRASFIRRKLSEYGCSS